MKSYSQLFQLIHASSREELKSAITSLAMSEEKRNAITKLVFDIADQKNVQPGNIKMKHSILIGSNPSQFFNGLFNSLMTKLANINDSKQSRSNEIDIRIDFLIKRRFYALAAELLVKSTLEEEKNENWMRAYSHAVKLSELLNSKFFNKQDLPPDFGVELKIRFYWRHMEQANQIRELISQAMSLDLSSSQDEIECNRKSIEEALDRIEGQFMLTPRSKVLLLRARHHLALGLGELLKTCTPIQEIIGIYESKDMQLSSDEYSHYLSCYLGLSSAYTLLGNYKEARKWIESLKHLSGQSHPFSEEANVRYCIARISLAYEMNAKDFKKEAKEIGMNFAKWFQLGNSEMTLHLASILAQYFIKVGEPGQAVKILTLIVLSERVLGKESMQKACYFIYLAAQSDLGNHESMPNLIGTIEKQIKTLFSMKGNEETLLELLKIYSVSASRGDKDKQTESKIDLAQYLSAPENRSITDMFDWDSWLTRID